MKIRPQSLADAVTGSAKALTGVCGWVILARTMLAVLDRWALWILPSWGRSLIIGTVELSNGILSAPAGDTGFVLAAGMLGFGGLCVMMQTASVTRGLSLRSYFPGKIFQACICTAAASIVRGVLLPLWLWGLLAITAGLCAAILRKSKIRYGNPAAVGV